MAAYQSPIHPDDTSLHKLATCMLCKSADLKSTLKTLPCFHSACLDCLQSYAKEPPSRMNWCKLSRRRDPDIRKAILCPFCRNMHLLPEDISSNLEDNIFTANRKLLSDILSNSPPNCKACLMAGEVTNSSTYCLLCRNHFCQNDGPRHMATPGHEVISHSELHSRKVIPKILSSYSERCEDSDIHEDPQPYKHYCIKCQKLSCGECLTYKHECHRKMPLKAAKEEVSITLKTKIAAFKEKKAKQKETLQSMQAYVSWMKRNSDTTAKKIKTFGNDIKKLVDTYVNESLESLNNETIRREKRVKGDMTEIAQQEKNLDVAIIYLETFLSYGSHFNILNKYKQYTDNCDNILRNNRDIHLSEMDSFSINYEMLFEIQRIFARTLLGEKLISTERMLSALTQHEFDDIAVDQSNKDIIAVSGKAVHIFEMNGDKKEEIECQGLGDACSVAIYNELIFIADNSRKEIVGFDRYGTKRRCIKLPECTPTMQRPCSRCGARYGIGITINQANGTMYIACKETETIYTCSITDTHVKPLVTEGLECPLRLCVIPNKGLVVSDHRIKMFSFVGDLLWIYSNTESRETVIHPSGVCADHLGNIFLGDRQCKRIQCISSEGHHIYRFDLKNIGQAIALDIRYNKLFVIVRGPKRNRNLLVLQNSYDDRTSYFDKPDYDCWLRRSQYKWPLI